LKTLQKELMIFNKKTNKILFPPPFAKSATLEQINSAVAKQLNAILLRVHQRLKK